METPRKIRGESSILITLLLLLPYILIAATASASSSPSTSSSNQVYSGLGKALVFNTSVTAGPMKFCKPVILDLSPLGLRAGEVSAAILHGQGLVYLPSLPYPLRKVTYSIASGYSPRKVQGSPLVSATLYTWNRNSSKLLVLLPCNESEKPGTSLPRGLNAYGVYMVGDLRVYIVPKPSYGLGLESVPLIPGRVEIHRYQARQNGTPVTQHSIILVNLEEVAQRHLPVIEPSSAKEPAERQTNTRDITRYSNGGYVWARLFPVGISSHYGLWVNWLENKETIIRKGATSWNKAIELRLPPRTVRYEVWLLLSSQAKKQINVSIWLNDVQMVNSIYTVEPSRPVLVGLHVSRGLEKPGNYFTEWSKVVYRVSIRGRDLGGLRIRITPLARMWIGSLSRDNLVYNWSTRAAGLSTKLRGVEGYPPLVIRHGDAQVYLSFPQGIVENSGSLKLVIYSEKGVTASRHVLVYLGNELICDGYSVQEQLLGAYREVYNCSARNVFTDLVGSMRLGSGAPLKIVVVGAGNEAWYADGIMLHGLARALSAVAQLVYAVPSLPRSAGSYATVVAEPSSVLLYSTCDKSSQQVLIAQLASLIETSRPVKSNVPMTTWSYIVARVADKACLGDSLADIALARISTSIETRSANKLLLDYCATRLGEINASPAPTKIPGIAGLLSFVFSSTASLVTGVPIALAGAWSLAALIPASLYRTSSATSSVALDNPYETVVMGKWSNGWKPSTMAGLRLCVSYRPREISGWSNGVSIETSSYAWLYVLVYKGHRHLIVEKVPLNASLFAPPLRP